jgi:hypothetical protein
VHGSPAHCDLKSLLVQKYLTSDTKILFFGHSGALAAPLLSIFIIFFSSTVLGAKIAGLGAYKKCRIGRDEVN